MNDEDYNPEIECSDCNKLINIQEFIEELNKSGKYTIIKNKEWNKDEP